MGVDVAEGEAVGEEGELGEGGEGDDDNGGEVEGFEGVGGFLAEFEQGEHDDDAGDGGHQEAEDDVAGGFDAGFARREAAGVDAANGAIAGDEGDIGEGVEDGVGHGGEEGEGAAGGYGGVDLEDGEDEVGGEGAADGDLVFEVVLAVEFFGGADMLVDGLEPAVDAFILVFIEVLQLFGFVGGVVEGDGTVAIAFARGVGPDEVDFVAGLEFGGELIRVVLRCVVGREILYICCSRCRGCQIVACG